MAYKPDAFTAPDREINPIQGANGAEMLFGVVQPNEVRGSVNLHVDIPNRRQRS
jgi:hypothetical protein